MTIRITHTSSEDMTVLQVAGWLEGEDSGELIRVVEASACPVALDLEHLRSADVLGIGALRSLLESGVDLRQMSPVVQLLLERARRESKSDP